jgi:hypothetical protein
MSDLSSAKLLLGKENLGSLLYILFDDWSDTLGPTLTPKAIEESDTSLGKDRI